MTYKLPEKEIAYPDNTRVAIPELDIPPDILQKLWAMEQEQGQEVTVMSPETDAHEHMDALIDMQEFDDFFELQPLQPSPQGDMQTQMRPDVMPAIPPPQSDVMEAPPLQQNPIDYILEHIKGGTFDPNKQARPGELPSKYLDKFLEFIMPNNPEFLRSGQQGQEPVERNWNMPEGVPMDDIRHRLPTQRYQKGGVVTGSVANLEDVPDLNQDGIINIHDYILQQQGVKLPENKSWYPGKYVAQALGSVSRGLESHGQDWYPGKHIGQGVRAAGRGAGAIKDLFSRAYKSERAQGMMGSLKEAGFFPSTEELHPAKIGQAPIHQGKGQGQFNMPVLAAIASFINKKLPIDPSTKSIVQSHVDKLTAKK